MPEDLSPPPVRPTNLAVASRSSNSLAITWDAASYASRYELEVSWAGESRIFSALGPQKLEDLLSTASVPLFSNRIYKIRVRAVNSQGSSAWSDWLVTATLPPTPTPPSAYSSMIEVDVKLSWDVALSAQVDRTFPLFVEIARKELDGEIKILPNATNLALQGEYTDEVPLAENSYFVRLYSELPLPISRNTSEWSVACFFRKQVFAKLEIPGIQESNTLRNQLMRKYYGQR